MRPDEGDGGPVRPKLFDGESELKTSPEGLTDYAGNIFKIFMNFSTESVKAFAHLPMVQSKALVAFRGEAGTFAEGKMANQMMHKRVLEFQRFFADVGVGLEAIAFASQAVGDAYGGTDSDNAATLGDISFAFGDRGATQPKGFKDDMFSKDYKTIEDQRAAAMASGGTYTAAMGGLYGDFKGSQASDPHAPETYRYPDGSYVLVQTTRTQTPYGYVDTTTRTVYDKDNKQLASQSSQDFHGDNTVTTKQGAVTETTVTHTNPDGSVTYTTTHEVNGQQSAPRTTTVYPNQHNDAAGSQGPVEVQEKVLDSHGDDYHERLYGKSY
ncbi:hypothetical protein Lfu02_14080 [Longispora fulva]|uniref:Uncharacterized protein n=1 Tax=Longispora fulva TaxID=619741 RepID=A0A8J7KZA2_9ACTN|nr:hypothetical protein [Longispora fulva]MBG6140582.1 hypothetical protein [Longispora fulva]GIG57036.1 hypothetical protein Lfu02_14080 [Longispora fulva]